MSEPVYCVAIAFKMTEQIEQWICIRFCIKLEHSSKETIQMIQKAEAVGNWWLAASSWQHAHSCIMFHAEFFVETSNHRGDSAPLQPRFGTLWLLAFPKTKIIFERDEISDHKWDLGKYNRVADEDWENCVRSYGVYFEGDWVIVLCTMFLVSCIFFNKYVYFLYYMAGYLLVRPHHIYTHIYVRYMYIYIYIYIYIHTHIYVRYIYAHTYRHTHLL